MFVRKCESEGRRNNREHSNSTIANGPSGACFDERLDLRQEDQLIHQIVLVDFVQNRSRLSNAHLTSGQQRKRL